MLISLGASELEVNKDICIERGKQTSVSSFHNYGLDLFILYFIYIIYKHDLDVDVSKIWPDFNLCTIWVGI